MTNNFMLNRTNVFLLIHAVILSLLFAMKFFGVATDVILVVAAAVISMEAIYMAVFTKEATGKACQGVKNIEADMIMLRETASETIKLQRAFLYTGHQIKNIQQELDFLKRRADFKTNGSGNHKHLSHQVVSH